MNSKTRNTALGLFGLGALSVYILACTSFSPDDSKVLCPAYDTESGAFGIAVYDREAKRTDTAIVAVPAHEAKSLEEGTLMRAQWLDKSHILTAWASDGDEDALHLAVQPWGERGATRIFRLPGVREAGQRLVLPLAVVNDQAFVLGESNLLLRLDLRTGATESEKGEDRDEITLYPDPDGKAVFFAYGGHGDTNLFGRINPVTFERKVLAAFTNRLAEMSFIVFDPSGKRLAFVEDPRNDSRRVVVLDNGVEVFSRELPSLGDLTFGSAVLLPKGDQILASYQRGVPGTNRADFGLMEIPLKNQPVRETPIITGLQTDEKAYALYWQVGLSHDLSTAALCSTYICGASKEPKPDACGLYFVDLKSPGRKVIRVPLPVPKLRPNHS
jgi:hypothetical protein